MPTKLEEVLEFLQCIKFSGNCCILASLGVREFLKRIDVEADVKSVAVQLKATAFETNLPMHNLGVGCNDLWNTPYTGKDWDGHMIVTVPGHIIDMTFYQMRRKAWEWIGDVAVASRTNEFLSMKFDNGRTLPIIAKMNEYDPVHNYKFEAIWIANTSNKGWKNAPDYRDASRRKSTADDIMEGWKEWNNRRAK